MEEFKIVIHGISECKGENCVFHNPSDHPLNDKQTNIRFDRAVYVDGVPKAYLTERICDHGVGHPDPDSMAYLLSIGAHESEGVHGCDGCCGDKEEMNA